MNSIKMFDNFLHEFDEFVFDGNSDYRYGLIYEVVLQNNGCSFLDVIVKNPKVSIVASLRTAIPFHKETRKIEFIYKIHENYIRGK